MLNWESEVRLAEQMSAHDREGEPSPTRAANLTSRCACGHLEFVHRREQGSCMALNRTTHVDCPCRGVH